jgi:hypothetical protein
MVEVAEKISEEVTENLAQNQAIELIRDSTLPPELSQHYFDLIEIFGKDVNEAARAHQILSLSDELNLAKREYLNKNKLESLPEASELIYRILLLYKI